MHTYMCVCIYTCADTYIHVYILVHVECPHTPPFHLSLLLHPNLEFFIPQLPRCVLFYILCKFLPVCPPALRVFRPFIPASRGL